MQTFHAEVESRIQKEDTQHFTVHFIYDDQGQVFSGLATCGKDDPNFSKTTGRNIAKGRAEKALKIFYDEGVAFMKQVAFRGYSGDIYRAWELPQKKYIKHEDTV